MDFKKLSILIPVYNEEKTVRHVLEKVFSVELINSLDKEIIIVDDCSKDNTRQQIEKFIEDFPDADLKFSQHDKNRGKGAAIRTGINKATGEYVIIQDADLEYDPAEFPRLIQPIVEGKADVVFGSRFLGDHPHRVLYYWHYLGNHFLTTLSNCFTNLNLTDMETCYKVFSREVMDSILPTLQQNRFGFEPEVTAKIARRHFRIYEMSCSYSGRTYDQGKKIGWKDGFSALWCIVRYAFRD